MATWTQENYNALCEAIGQGVNEVYYGDKRVVYRSLSEMLSIKSLMEQELGINVKPSRTYAEFSKGLK